MSPNPVLEFWAYATLCVDTNDDVSKTKASIDAVKTDKDIFPRNCTFCSGISVENKNNKP